MPKKIVEVAVDDSAFERFRAKFAEYEDGLDASVAAWMKVGATTKAAAGGTAALAGAMGTMVALMAENNALLQDAVSKGKKLNDQEEKRARTVKSTLADVKKIAGQVKDTTSELMKWGSIAGIFGTALFTGGLFGMDALASSATGMRRSSLAVGVSPGELQASKLSFGQYMDAQGNLEAISNNKGDLSKAWVWRALGVNPNQNNIDLQEKLFDRARAITTSTNPNQLAQTAARTGLDQFFNMDDLRTIRNLQKEDIADIRTHLAQSRAQIEITNKEMRTWADLNYTLEKTKTQIEFTFLRALAPLAPQIEALASDFANMLAELAKDGVIKDFIGKIGDGLHWLDNKLKDPKLGAELHDFLVKIEGVTEGLFNLLQYLKLIPQTAKQVTFGGADVAGAAAATVTGTPGGMMDIMGKWVAGKISGWFADGGVTGKQVGFAKDMMSLGLDRHTAAGISANISAESAFNPLAWGDQNKSGRYTAYGLGQWHADRQADYARLFGHTMQSVRDPRAAMHEQMAFIRWELERRGLLNRYGSGGQAGATLSDKYESPKDRAGNMRGRGDLAARIELKISNSTGSDVCVKGAACAH